MTAAATGRRPWFLVAKSKVLAKLASFGLKHPWWIPTPWTRWCMVQTVECWKKLEALQLGQPEKGSS